jgi:UDP:flavonoid glycosyltransferase YjiC (YdhE family)
VPPTEPPPPLDVVASPSVRLLAACSLGGAGHLQPLVPFLLAAHERGHETLVVAPGSLGAMVADAGLRLHPGGEPPEAAVAPIRERLPVAPREEASRLGNGELFGRLATRAMLPAVEAAVREWRPSLVIREPCEYASAIVARRSHIPTVQVAISVAEGEWGSIAHAAPVLEELHPGITDTLTASPYLSRFPPSFDPSPFPVTLRYRDPLADPVGPPPWLERFWSDVAGPRIYLSFGTVLGHMSIASAVYRVALDAVGSLEARVLLTTGRHFDPAQLGEVPSNVRVEPWVDQASVLSRADLVVCHGGSGTVLGALGAGVPLVVVPLFADQFENAGRVAALGAGAVVESTAVHPSGRRDPTALDAGTLAAAIESVLSAGAHRRAAANLAAEMAAAPGPGDLLDQLAR